MAVMNKCQAVVSRKKETGMKGKGKGSEIWGRRLLDRRTSQDNKKTLRNRKWASYFFLRHVRLIVPA